MIGNFQNLLKTLYDPMKCSCQASLSFTISRSLLKLMSIESVMQCNHLILCCQLLLLPSIFPRISLGKDWKGSQFFTSGGQNTGTSASASALPVNIQGLSSLRLTGLISLMSKGLSGVFSSTTVQRHQGGTCIILPRNLCIFHNPLQDWGTLGDPEGYISNG